MNYTNDQLKQLLAKMLPETVEWRYIIATAVGTGQGYHCLCWKPGCNVLDTELLHLCSLVEAGLDWKQLLEYDRKLEQKCWYEDGESNDGRLSLIRATWQQRTRALAEVKGVTP